MEDKCINDLMFLTSSLGKWMIVCGVELGEKVVTYYTRRDGEGFDVFGSIPHPKETWNTCISSHEFIL